MTDNSLTHTGGNSSPPEASPPGAGVSPWLQDARRFVVEIQRICASDRGARAALRRGEGKGLDEAPGMHRIVAPLLPGPVLHSEDAQRAYYTVAALIAAQRRSETPAEEAGVPQKQKGQPPSPQSALYGHSLGVAFAAAVNKGTRDGMRESAAETRLNLLTRQSVQGIHRHLPAAARQLSAKKTPPDWARLLVDLRNWHEDRGRIARYWLQDFYRDRRRDDLRAARAAADALDAGVDGAAHT